MWVKDHVDTWKRMHIRFNVVQLVRAVDAYLLWRVNTTMLAHAYGNVNIIDDAALESECNGCANQQCKFL